MHLFGNLIIRAITIIIGYGFAVLAIALFLSFGYFREVFTGQIDGFHGEQIVEGVSIGLLTLYLGFVITWIGALPATIAIAIAELMRWRSAPTYLVLGAISALFAGFTEISVARTADISNATLVILLACGFVGGFVFWLIAGRSAGGWMPPPAKNA